jgi:N-methylhydantoinase A
LSILQSDGGVVSAEEAAENPIHTLLSGPAGGVVGAWRAAQSAGYDRIIALDMGGTSTDVSLINGAPTMTRESSIGGWPLAVATLDIHTVGAGGGSIAWCDTGGAMRVGPQSAGAHPGPACYGIGEAPTVTDAQVVLGRLPSSTRLGRAMTIDAGRAQAAVEGLGNRLAMDSHETAAGIVAVVNAHMVGAIKVISLERGHDPRDVELLSFGGAGGLHACELACALDMATVLIPPAPGLLSALGMLASDLKRTFSQSVLQRLQRSRLAAAVAGHPAWSALSARAAELFGRHAVPMEEQEIAWTLDLRYVGQSHELTIAATADLSDLLEAFEARHEWRYGYRFADRDVEWVALHATARQARRRLRRVSVAQRAGSEAPTEDGVINRHNVASTPLSGPLVIIEYGATHWVPAGWTVVALPDGCLRLERA